MNIGWCGLGRLGITCALAMAKHGSHHITGYDPSDRPRQILAGEVPPPEEAGIEDLLDATAIDFADSPAGVVAATDGVVLVSVQTPHDPRFGGESRMPDRPVDFEYGYLVQAVRDIAQAAEKQAKPITIVVVSTVLPGTTRARLAPLCGPNVRLVYGPYFIAMSTTVQDFLQPEFVLLGSDDPHALADVADMYKTIHDRPVHAVSIESAELLKVAYNCFISMKIVFANMVMEICQKTGADCDQIADGLALATDRIASPAYMRGGMGDSGGCHPRDNQAMSWLAGRLALSVDLMGYVSEARERQSAYLADLVEHWHRMSGLPVTLLGKAYKPNVSLTQGSAGLLLAEQLRERDLQVDHKDIWVDDDFDLPVGPQVYVITAKHDYHTAAAIAPGSVVIDPHGYMPDQPGVTTIRVGRKT
ncbi:hypothetical protein [Streptomyces sp. NPDC020747]|uniref:hypothetical protein n=1 Tax=Streptomyces sp. NPDC020747 TaxID=3365086 RepID=UPI0037B4E2A9